MSLSRIAKQCRECPFVDKCENKRMEALGYIPGPPYSVDANQAMAENAAMPVLRETITVIIDGKPVTQYKDEIEKELYKSLYKGLGLDYGA